MVKYIGFFVMYTIGPINYAPPGMDNGRLRTYVAPIRQHDDLLIDR